MTPLAITGATGFLGRHLVSECLKREGFQLRLLTRERQRLEHLRDVRVELCEGDLLKPESFGGFLRPECTLVHLAYSAEAGSGNLRAVRNLIAAIQTTRVRRVVHCSTAVVVGNTAKGVVTEETTPEPTGAYQRTKYLIEEEMRSRLPSGVEVAVLRPTEVIGPGGRGLEGMIDRLKNDGWLKKFILHCALKNRRFNYVSVHNVVSALILLATTPAPQRGEIYNISDDDDPDNNYASVERLVHSTLGKESAYSWEVGLPGSALSLLFKLLPNNSPPNRAYSHSKIAALGYRKKTRLREAIAEILSAG